MFKRSLNLTNLNMTIAQSTASKLVLTSHVTKGTIIVPYLFQPTNSQTNIKDTLYIIKELGAY